MNTALLLILEIHSDRKGQSIVRFDKQGLALSIKLGTFHSPIGQSLSADVCKKMYLLIF